MWYLIIIFISASINLSLIKIFPQVLADYDAIFYCLTHDELDKRPATSSPALEPIPFICKNVANECVAIRQRALFIIACKDFYDRLNVDQKHSFRDIFSNLQDPEIYEMLKAL